MRIEDFERLPALCAPKLPDIVRTAAPSYVLPVETDNLLNNIRYLRNAFDCIQLLCFGKNYTHEILNDTSIKQMRHERSDGLEYILHLPSDYNFCENFQQDSQSLCSIISQADELDVKRFILHEDCLGNDESAVEMTLEALAGLIPSHFHKLRVENTKSGLMAFRGAVERLGLKLCLDIGHIMKRGLSIEDTLSAFEGSIDTLHIHGLNEGKDHSTFTFKDDRDFRALKTYLLKHGTICVLELFELEALKQSMTNLANFLDS